MCQLAREILWTMRVGEGQSLILKTTVLRIKESGGKRGLGRNGEVSGISMDEDALHSLHNLRDSEISDMCFIWFTWDLILGGNW